jgi:hypothetical protein
MSMHLTSQELDATRAKYRGEIIPAGDLSVMDAETEALRASGIERRALKPGAIAPDFMLPDAQGRCVRLQSLLGQGPVVLVFYRRRLVPLLQFALAGLSTGFAEVAAIWGTSRSCFSAIARQFAEHTGKG